MSEKKRSSGGSRSRSHTPRTAARLAAVQALYSMDYSGISADAVLHDFLSRQMGSEAIVEDPDTGDESTIPLEAPHSGLLTMLVRGAVADRERIEMAIAGALEGGWSMQRLEDTLGNILRAAVAELIHNTNVSARTIISEYVDLARAFYDGPEVGLANAVLDKLARSVRPEEFADQA